ncbi:hypothetical protein LCGC14_1927020 [marine sediment metagenome]|uniref:Uncharacterized protein n=1 Tax=marine sediment metagenome TaxID=412755 RepID=A0A0F9FP00_9ZZZZ
MANGTPQIGGGQFAQATGGGDVLRQAMERRGLSTSVLDSISPTSPTGPSPVAPALPEGAGVGGGALPEQAVATTAVGGKPPPIPFRSGEMEISLKALNSVISTENAIAKSALKLQGL